MYGMADEDQDADFVDASEEVMELTLKSYDMPFGMSYIKKWKWARYVPFSPTFKGINLNLKKVFGCNKACKSMSRQTKKQNGEFI